MSEKMAVQRAYCKLYSVWAVSRKLGLPIPTVMRHLGLICEAKERQFRRPIR